MIADTSRIWWDLRPSARYPTLETRVMDCCTTLEDALRLAALNQCLMRMLYRLRRANQRWRMYSHLLLGENRWRAMRYSYDAGLLDLGQQRIVPFAELLEELIALVREDAEALGCVAEVERLREIIARGTSAHRQLRVYDQALAGRRRRGGTRAVVDWLSRGDGAAWTPARLDRRICVAPMMDYTDRHCRYLLRLLSPRALLYTEMVTAQALAHGDVERLLGFDRGRASGRAAARRLRPGAAGARRAARRGSAATTRSTSTSAARATACRAAASAPA